MKLLTVSITNKLLK